jgi:hypothetical protein
MRPRPKGTARYRSRPRVLGITLPPTTPFSNSLYHSSLHIISNTANSSVRIDKSGAQITEVTGDIGDGTEIYL